MSEKTFFGNFKEVQELLKAPKNQRNSFGNYNYRSAEDILEAVKPLLHERDLAITLFDEIISVGERYYIKATVTVTNGKDSLSASAIARESENKKGMDEAQVTGSASSYARKYALNGLFAIDDTKDADTNEQAKEVRAKTELTTEEKKQITEIKELETLNTICRDMLNKKGITYKEAILALYNVQKTKLEGAV